MKKHQLEITEILYQALHSKNGVVVETNKFDHTRQLFYRGMKENPEFANLSITRSRTNPDTELVILRKNNE